MRTTIDVVLVILVALCFMAMGAGLRKRSMSRLVVEHKCAHWTIDQEGHAKLIWNDDGSEVK